MNRSISATNPLTAIFHEDGKEFLFEYYDATSFDDLPLSMVKQVYGVCFYNNQMVIGYNGKTSEWGLVGGSRESEETIDQVLVREIKEETNMEILAWMPIGIQKVTDSNKEIRYELRVVSTVRPFDDFVFDPAGSITEIKLVDPTDYKQYFDWGEIGERVIKRAVELLPQLE